MQCTHHTVPLTVQEKLFDEHFKPTFQNSCISGLFAPSLKKKSFRTPVFQTCFSQEVREVNCKTQCRNVCLCICFAIRCHCVADLYLPPPTEKNPCFIMTGLAVWRRFVQQNKTKVKNCAVCCRLCAAAAFLGDNPQPRFVRTNDLTRYAPLLSLLLNHLCFWHSSEKQT